MTYWLLLLFIILCIGLFLLQIKDNSKIIQYPFLALMVFVGWVLPQLIGLAVNNHVIPHGSLEKLLFMTTLCLLSVVLGDYSNNKPLNLFCWRFNNHRLLIGSTCLSLFGFYFFLKVGQLAEETTKIMGGAWSGPITIYVFLSKAMTFGFVIAMLLYLRKPSIWALGVVIFDILCIELCFWVEGRLWQNFL